MNNKKQYIKRRLLPMLAIGGQGSGSNVVSNHISKEKVLNLACNLTTLYLVEQINCAEF